MSLSIDQPILANEIADACSLAGENHTVYLLQGFDKSKLVIKKEKIGAFGEGEGRKEALRTNLNLMHAVDRDAKVVVMTGAEVEAIKVYVDYLRHVAMATGEALSREIQFLWDRLGEGGKWTKMRFKQLTQLDKAVEDRLGGNKAGVRRFAAKLNAPGGLEKLGEIIAVDLFNDNGDRFCLEGGMGFNGTILQFLFNLGNVLLSAGQVSGLDSFDPNSPHKKPRQPLSRDYAWGGKLLSADSVRVRDRVITKGSLAEGIVADLEVVLGPRDRKFFLSRKQRLAIDAKRRIKQGIASGTTKIRDHLRRLAGQAGGVGNLSVSMKEKIDQLGWDPL